MPFETYVPDTATKICRVCNRELRLEDFYPDTCKSDGFRSECRECYNEQQRIRRLAPKPGPECEACGSTRSRVLDLDEEGEVRGTLCKPCKQVAATEIRGVQVLSYLAEKRKAKRSGRVW